MPLKKFLPTALLLVLFATPVLSAETYCVPAELASIAIAEETELFHIDVKYPVLCQPQATRTLRDHATRTVADFKKDFPEPAPVPFRYKNELITQYSVSTAAHNRLASVILQTMVYTGGAHPNHWPDTWTFDMTDGRTITLEDLFPDTQTALNQIAEAVRPILKTKLADMYVKSMFEDGVAPKIDNFRSFILEESGITFLFPPYQVGPYAAGQQTATIPFKLVENMFASEFKRILK